MQKVVRADKPFLVLGRNLSISFFRLLGAAVIRMLAGFLGAVNFKTGLANYLEKKYFEFIFLVD